MSRDYSFSAAFISLWGTVMGLLGAVILFQLYLVVHGSIDLSGISFLHIGVVIALAFFHEIIHLLVFLLSGHCRLNQIKLGFNAKYLLPYVHCEAKIRADLYRNSTFAPGLFLGFIPFFAGLISHNPEYFLIGLIMLVSAVGDFMVLWKIRKLKRSQIVMDHPTRVGCSLIDED